MAKKIYTVVVPPKYTVVDIHGRRIGAGKTAKVYKEEKTKLPKIEEANDGN